MLGWRETGLVWRFPEEMPQRDKNDPPVEKKGIRVITIIIIINVLTTRKRMFSHPSLCK